MLYLRKRKIALKKGLMLLALFFLSVAILQIKTICFSFLPIKSSVNHAADVGIVILVCLITYKPIEQFVNYLFREFFFKKGIGFHTQLIHSTNHLVSCLDLKEFSNFLVNTLSDLLHVKYVAFLIYDQKQKEFVPGALAGFNFRETRKIRFEKDSPLINKLRESSFPVLRFDVLKRVSWPEASRFNTDFELLRAQVVIPVFYGEEVIGFITLSSKPSHLPYLPHELKLLHDFSGRISFGLENAIRFNEMKQRYEELKDFQSRLVHSNKFSAIEQLATGIAHEIHNPLTIISGKAQMLLLNRDKNFLTAKAEEDLKMIVQQTTRAAEITRKLLVFSKSSPEQKAPLSFREIIDDTFELISYQTSIDHVRIIKEISPNLPAIKGHVEEFREVFLNLILNAVQSVERDGVIKVLVDYSERDQSIEIKVEDSGCGIKKEHLSSVFDPFFTTKQNSLGLGLFVTQRVVQRNGGYITIESEAYKGTEVTILLPVPETNEKQPIFSTPVFDEKVSYQGAYIDQNQSKEE
ncbi:MAG: GAF domain-containing protein [Candidatus Omnitrophica bacterium]|nr:GAF domain-containing protein [Candidatus Omnitrophota bacterium]